VQAAAGRDRVDQGLQLRWRGRRGPRWPPALQCDPGEKPGACCAQRPRPRRRWRGTATRGPPLSAAGSWPRCRGLVWWPVIVEPGVPAEAERAVDQGLVAADRDVGADLEAGPAQLAFDLLIALLDSVPDAVDPRGLGQGRGRVRAVSFARAPGLGKWVTRYQVALSGKVAGSAVAATRRRAPSGPQAPKVASAAYQVSVWPSRKVRVTACHSPGSSGPARPGPARSRPAHGLRPPRCARPGRRPRSRGAA
jgi:hypothetical protein